MTFFLYLEGIGFKVVPNCSYLCRFVFLKGHFIGTMTVGNSVGKGYREGFGGKRKRLFKRSNERWLRVGKIYCLSRNGDLLWFLITSLLRSVSTV